MPLPVTYVLHWGDSTVERLLALTTHSSPPLQNYKVDKAGLSSLQKSTPAFCQILGCRALHENWKFCVSASHSHPFALAISLGRDRMWDSERLKGDWMGSVNGVDETTVTQGLMSPGKPLREHCPLVTGGVIAPPTAPRAPCQRIIGNHFF